MSLVNPSKLVNILHRVLYTLALARGEITAVNGEEEEALVRGNCKCEETGGVCWGDVGGEPSHPVEVSESLQLDIQSYCPPPPPLFLPPLS